MTIKPGSGRTVKLDGRSVGKKVVALAMQGSSKYKGATLAVVGSSTPVST
jgi:hypothetical protein